MAFHYHLNREEQTPVRKLARSNRMNWSEIVTAAEEVLGRSWSEMPGDRGDWGRDGAMYVAVRRGGHRLSDIVREVGGMTYGAGAQAVRRFAAATTADRDKAKFVAELTRRLRDETRV